MAETLLNPALIAESPDISHIITEDDTPVDNMFSGIQQRLLVEALYSSWTPGRPFIAASNVGIFNTLREPPIVPDMFLSLDVEPAEDLWVKEHRSYFLWEFGKPPEVVIEVVSNKIGGEKEKKFRKYARLGIWYYAIYDPQRLIQEEELRVYVLSIGRYVLYQESILTEVGLGLTVWEGEYEGSFARWLRWCDEQGQLIQTGAERTAQAEQYVKQSQQQAKQERQRAEHAQQRAERLAAQLRALGIEPDNGQGL